MAFDLNKNDGYEKKPSDHIQASSKFDLSKGTAESTVAAHSSKSKVWIIGLAGILVIGGGIWYYSANKKMTNTAIGASTRSASSNLVAAASTPAKEQNNVTAASGTSTQRTNNSEKAIAADLENVIPATFARGSSDFNRIDQSLIERILTYLAKNPNASIHIEGYASSDGSLVINQAVSQARADVFKKYLESKGVAERRIKALGRGIDNPVASNTTEEGRKKNRRVEIKLP